ncbi:MAG: alpha/beta hydrolase [Alicyclobacillus macrosporangiidus]|uniref:alpha/beta fold hydrolase n=1 Tax=Alicyclobacillus macrosporangiidus TaxID=392015 RepID=UPI0026EAF017|nr:alpha/beta hydrolase [Alicyclobacillus macrosporangiidus]MCL6598602.1 alpha/beta hydrolase [Alicyclobacillus macrosporangiidus]
MSTAGATDARLWCRRIGAGVPLLFVPPPVIGAAAFQRVEELLADRYEILRVELRGHGASPRASGPYDYAAVSADLADLMMAQGLPRAVVVGYSMGATMALDFTLTYPERVMAAVLVGAFSEPRHPLLRLELALGAHLSRSACMPLVRAAIAAGNAPGLGAFRLYHRAGSRAHAREVRDLFRCARRYSCTRRLGEILVPVCLVYGGRDPIRRPHSDLLRRGLPDSELVILPGVRHEVPTKAAEGLAGVIDTFLHQRGFGR